MRSPGSAGPPSGADVAVAVKDHAHDQVHVNVNALVSLLRLKRPAEM